MNREEILALSGPKLSEAVARHVMGWKPVVLGNYEDVGSVWDAGGKWKLIPRIPFRQKDGGLFAIVAEVWEPHAVVDDAIGIVTENDTLVFMCARGVWSASWDNETRKGPLGSTGDNLASLICRAALLVKFAT